MQMSKTMMKIRALLRHLHGVLIGGLLAGGNSVTWAQTIPDAITDSLSVLNLEVPSDAISPSEIDGIYVVRYGLEVLYITADGRYLVRGDIIDLQQRRNLTEGQRRLGRLEALRAIAPEDFIVFSAKQEKHTLTVFTDIDCPYCQKLHGEVELLNDAGITVRYLAFPRGGIKSPAYQRMVSIWCAADRQAAMTAAKTGGAVEEKNCENQVLAQHQLGLQIPVRGTPTLVLDNGEVVGGYVPAAGLIQRLGVDVSSKAQPALKLKYKDPAVVTEGKQLYRGYCGGCHGVERQGAPNWHKRNAAGYLPAPPHDETGHTWHHNDKLLFELTKFGPKVTAGEDYKTHMPAYEGVLSDNEIIAVLSYIKSTWPEEVIEIHNKEINNN
ncbi:MAG: thioredoxin fold domain-containing protein [Acidiferrobacteraceae bacterium]|nr:thioredoxin fold domain-containing protein [Acidiferrobacteraceae bacterium]MBT6786503.1 thioredoxin fold domain-containing protein [Acidiferrobacteraceae bacterium]MBT7517885.1 thioredoxin fold domain-containing protein [Acidiferrobacteraceae bacterium]